MTDSASSSLLIFEKNESIDFTQQLREPNSIGVVLWIIFLLTIVFLIFYMIASYKKNKKNIQKKREITYKTSKIIVRREFDNE